MFVENYEEKLSEKNILVYKIARWLNVCSSHFISEYQHFYYEREKLYTTTLDSIEFDKVSYGFHSYRNLPIVSTIYVIGLFIIPKGSIYIEGFDQNEEGEPCYVSNQIIYVGLYNENTLKEVKKYNLK